MSSVAKVTSKNYASLLAQSKQYPILVLIGRPGCPYCKQGLSILRGFAARWQGGRAGYLSDPDFPEVATKTGVKTLPGYLLFWRGRAVRKTEGLTRAAELAKFVRP